MFSGGVPCCWAGRPEKSSTDRVIILLGESYGGARVCQESCAWGREKDGFYLGLGYNMADPRTLDPPHAALPVWIFEAGVFEA